MIDLSLFLFSLVVEMTNAKKIEFSVTWLKPHNFTTRNVNIDFTFNRLFKSVQCTLHIQFDLMSNVKCALHQAHRVVSSEQITFVYEKRNSTHCWLLRMKIELFELEKIPTKNVKINVILFVWECVYVRVLQSIKGKQEKKRSQFEF